MVRFPRKELKDLVRGLLGIASETVVWDTEKLPFVGQINGEPGYWVELSLTSMEQVGGSDDYRYQFDPVKLVNRTLIYGYRIVGINITVKSYSLETAASDVMETLLQLLARATTSLATLEELNLAIIDFTNSINKPVTKDSRVSTETTVDFRFGWIVVQDPGDDQGGWIEKLDPGPVGTLTS